jgi:UDP-N-acetylmuramoyl-L-alanyl-D-glutamate--2,6-diaminopimelate ligase
VKRIMLLDDLGKGCFDVPERLVGVDVNGLANDSRKVQPGCLFVATTGTEVDGHEFIHSAAKAGAVAVVGEARLPSTPAIKVPYFRVPDSRRTLGVLAARFFGVGRDQLHVAGVTGTKGKTTTAWILDSIFRNAGKVSGLFGTVHNRLGTEVCPSSNTTPPCLQLHADLRTLVDRGGTHAVLEVSSHGISQRRIAGVEFGCGILTNIAPEHLDYHKTFEKYIEAKAAFFTELPASAHVVLPRDEPASLKIAGNTRAQICWYGAEVHDGVEDLRMSCEALSFWWKGTSVRSRLWGSHNLLNILAAMTAAECMGFTLDDIALGIERAQAPPGRLEKIHHDGPFHVFVDYAHTDGSLETVLRSLRAVTPGRLITVFGCGGDRDRTKRPRMGRVAEKWSDQILVTSDNPRCEDPKDILEDIMRGLERPEEAVFEEDRRQAIALGIRMARATDTVLIAGKGHENYQEFEGQRLHFDDREVAHEFLGEGFEV